MKHATIENVTAAARNGRGAMIFLPSIPWATSLFQRPHHLARFFARAGFATVFDCDCAGPEQDEVRGFREIEPNLYLYRGPKQLLAELPDAALWTFPYNYNLVDAFPARFRTVYDWIDSLEIFYHRGPRLIHGNHARAMGEAHAIAAVTRTLHARALLTRRDALYLPNAVDCGHFAGAPPPPDDPEMQRLRAEGKPIAGYYGALASWFDYPLLCELARRRPDWNFVLIGPVYAEETKFELPQWPANVTWLGPREYDDLPRYLQLFDVAMIPFQLNEITRATSPLKLYEFFAGGKPVVAAALPECEAFPEVRTAGTAAQFSAALDAALADSRDAAFCERIRALGRRNSWECRVREAAEALQRRSAAPRPRSETADPASVEAAGPASVEAAAQQQLPSPFGRGAGGEGGSHRQLPCSTLKKSGFRSLGATAGLPSSEISGLSPGTAGQASSGTHFQQAARLFSAAVRRVRRLGARTLPADTRRGRCVRSLARRVRNIPDLGRRNAKAELTLADILRDNADRKGIVVSPPFIDWTWMRQRPHQLAAEFARAGYLSLYCSPRLWTDSFRGFNPVAERLYLCESVDLLLELPDPILLFGWTGHLDTARRFRQPVMIYDYLDNLQVSSEGGKPSKHKLEMHRTLVDESDVVLATAGLLYDEVRRRRPDAIFCPNGVDYGHFHLPAPPPAPVDIADMAASGRPIIGYYGALARWFDYDLVARAASARGDYLFLLIGPDFDGTLAASRLTRLPNVRWLIEKPYDQLPSYLHYFTVATIPFLVNDVTQSTSPVKLFEYMAGSKPIVTTDMPECRRYPCVHVARDADDFAAKLDEAVALAGREGHRRALDAEARNNTWDKRVRQIIAGLHARKERSGAYEAVAG